MEVSEVQGIADIEYDLEGTRRAAELVAPVASEGKRFREIESLEDQPSDTRLRLRTLLHLEASLDPSLDLAYLVAAGCLLFEAEMIRLLVDPARLVGAALVAALERKKKAGPAEALQAWAAGRLPATIGIASLVLLGLRYGLEAGDADCRRLIGTGFRPEFAALASAKHLQGAVDRVRVEYRNPACHGLKVFGVKDFEGMTALLVSQPRFADWMERGPGPHTPPGSGAVLHALLANAIGEKVRPPSALERLLALASPRASQMSVRVDVERADASPRKREVSVRPRRLARGLRLGDAVIFAVRATNDCSLALIDIGTAGTVTALLPNHMNPTPHAQANEVVQFPGQDDDFDFILEGRPGRERVVALAWRGGPAATLQPEGEATFRVLSDEEVGRVCDEITRLEDDDWGACVCEFEMLAK